MKPLASSLLLLLIAAAPAAQARLVVDLNRTPSPPASSNPGGMALALHGACFAATTPLVGREPWFMDSTGSVQLLADLEPGAGSSNPEQMTALDDTLFFTADTVGSGRELWFVPAVGQRPEEIEMWPGPEGSAPTIVAAGFARIWFVADIGDGRALWTCAGGLQTTRFVSRVRQSGDLTVEAAVPFGTGLAFVADDGVHGSELWVSDGTSAGTRLVVDLNSGPARGAAGMRPVALGGRLLFSGDDGSHGFEPFLTDGTAAGTRLLLDIQPGATGSFPSDFATLSDGRAVFAARAPSPTGDPWITDGTATGTAALQIGGRAGSNPNWFAATTDGRFFFRAISILARGLHVSDGTSSGTRAVPMPQPIAAGAATKGLVAVGASRRPERGPARFVAGGFQGRSVMATETSIPKEVALRIRAP